MGLLEEILECARAGISVGIRPLTTSVGYEVLEVVLERRKQCIGMLVNELNISSVLSYEELLCLTIKELRDHLHWKSEPHVHVEERTR